MTQIKMYVIFIIKYIPFASINIYITYLHLMTMIK